MSEQTPAPASLKSPDANRSLSVVVSLIVIVAAVLVGVRVRETAALIESRQMAWEQAAIGFSAVQRQFQAPTARESAALIAESRRLSALGVADGEQLNVMGAVNRLAEEASLLNVRVSSVPASGSVHRAERRIGGAAIKPASYEIAVEFEGSFARAVQFVSSLPSSVSVSRMTASRRAGPPGYQVYLSVYQVDANPGN